MISLLPLSLIVCWLFGCPSCAQEPGSARPVRIDCTLTLAIGGMLNSYRLFLDLLSTIIAAGLHLFYDGQSLPRDVRARVSVTSITTDNSNSGLACLYSSTTARSGRDNIMWFLNGTELDRRVRGDSWQSYLGWSVTVGVHQTYPTALLKRDAHTAATEGVFTCCREELSVVVGIYYPSK